ncbi:hypothetical protein HYS01_03335 [Candidatus Saccharibacteria bacterium]|nr:hypothetical protein [Candidatus Saccharibacteria bacterium]
MTKTKKKTKVSVLSRLRKPQMMIAMVFVLGFGGFGVYKLAFSSAATYQTSCRTRYLKLGDQGNCVKYLQDVLNKSGSQPILKVDGKFSIDTRSSVVNYKNTNGWGYADGYGVAGPDFANRMCSGAIPINYCIK